MIAREDNIRNFHLEETAVDRGEAKITLSYRQYLLLLDVTASGYLRFGIVQALELCEQ